MSCDKNMGLIRSMEDVWKMEKPIFIPSSKSNREMRKWGDDGNVAAHWKSKRWPIPPVGSSSASNWSFVALMKVFDKHRTPTIQPEIARMCDGLTSVNEIFKKPNQLKQNLFFCALNNALSRLLSSILSCVCRCVLTAKTKNKTEKRKQKKNLEKNKNQETSDHVIGSLTYLSLIFQLVTLYIRILCISSRAGQL